MSEYFVAGGIYLDHQGREHFALAAPDLEEAPYLMSNGLRRYFGCLCQKAHLYRVEKDFTLSLVAPSHKALAWGVKAPEKVILDQEMLAKLQAMMN